MSDTESDEDFKRAVALSLQETSPTPGIKSNVIDLVSDDDDEDDDLDAPVTTRKVRGPQDTSTKPLKSVKPGQIAATTSLQTNGDLGRETSNGGRQATMSATQTIGLLGLDRKAMEAERLQRQRKRTETSQPASSGKRHASISPPSLRRQEKASADSKASVQAHLTSQTNEEKRQKMSHIPPIVLSRNEEELLSKPGIQYPDGVVKKTCKC